MDEQNENSSDVITCLTDDVLLLLAKQYLDGKDCVHLSLSGAFERFAHLFGNNRKKLVISQCYFLKLNPWKTFFQQHISPAILTVFDASHCYWLRAEDISQCITQMSNVEELIIHDTKLSLFHLPKVFESCQKIVKFSFSLIDKNLDLYNEEEALLDWLKKGFSKLTHLKIFTFAFDGNDCAYFWPVTLGVLTWCFNCTDVLIEAAYSDPLDDAELDLDRVYAYRQEVASIYQNLFPKLSWMRESLENFMFIRRGDQCDPRDDFVEEFLGWLVSDEGQRPSLTSFQRLWMQDVVPFSPFNDRHLQSTESVISVELPGMPAVGFANYGELLHERYRHLLHLSLYAEENFRRLEYLPDLKYVRGCCLDAQGIDEFCQSHPLLEELHFDWDDFGEDEKLYLANNSNWNLQKLKTLVYRCDRPPKELIDHLVTSCPNIEALHINKTPKIHRDYKLLGPLKNADFLSDIRFQHLKFLTFDGLLLFDGSYLPSIIKQCSKLERFHIDGIFESRTFLSNLGQSLPLAKNLRDFRLQWDHIESDSDLVDFLKALLKCPLLERLVLDDRFCSHQSHQSSSQIENYLFSFVSNMEHLVAFCLSSLRFDDLDVIFARIKLNQRFVQEVIPSRPSFWFHLGKVLPKANAPSVPRIHSNEILHPIDWFDAPPKF